MNKSHSDMNERHGRSHALYAEVIQASLAVTPTSLRMHCSNFAIRRALSNLQIIYQTQCRCGSRGHDDEALYLEQAFS